jgi:hypothetical protein
MKAINASTRTAIVNAIVACESCDSAFDALRADVRKHKVDRETFESLAREACSVRYDVPLVTKSTGKVVFDSSAPKYETARKRLQRLMAEVFPTNQREDVEIPAELLKLAQALAKAANEYEGARSLAAKALAASFAK